MTQPEGPEPTPEPEVTVIEEPVVSEPVTTEEPATVDEVSDAELRAWAKENGIEGVPTSGKLSASWREQITAAMAAVLDPKDEDSAEDTSLESSTSVETTTTEETAGSESSSAPTELVQPEFEPAEYRSVFRAPNTFINSQAFTA